jgi:hypothetical protein
MIKEGTAMRTISKIVLLSAGVILSLTGCQKGNENDGNQASGKFVEFGAIAGAPGTRTEFSGVLTDGWERINWVEGDQLLIWSDNAVNRAGQSGKSAIYDLINIQPNGKESRAKIHRSGEDGLVFLDDENTPYQFWGIYPANAISAAPAAGELSYTIPATQTAGDMNNGVQLAYASIAKQQHVDLHFKPAFTAFSFEVAAAVPMKINGFTMTSVERKNGANTFGPSVLSGTVAAKVEEGADAWTYTVPAAGEGNTSISTTFATPFDLAFENEGDTKTNEAKFVLFAVPADITSLTLLFDVTVDGKAETRKVSISYAKDGEGFAKGDPVSFAGRKKHNIKNLVLPASVNHDVVLDFQVMPWNDSEDEVTYGPDDIVNAVALEYASGAGRTTGGGRRRNNWFLDETNPIIAYFSVFTPEEATWKIKVSGATDKFTVTGLSDGSTTDGTEITGPVGGRALFKIDRVGTVTESDEIYLNFYVVTSDDREISINSEITRGNALTISGKVGPYQP